MKAPWKLIPLLRPSTIPRLWRFYWDSEASTKDKWLLFAATAYIVSPVDLVPELAAAGTGTALAGPLGTLLGLAVGFVDDAFVISWLTGKLGEVRRTYGPRKG